jgi:hypothetical protein
MSTSNILILNRLKEKTEIHCGNRMDILMDNRCYHDDEDPYIATCPIKYTMYKMNNEYNCYKNCPENTTSANISSVDYSINLNGLQCLYKDYINNKSNNLINNLDTKDIAYTKEVEDIKCNKNDVLIDVVGINSKITKQCRKFIQAKETDPNKNPCPFGSELYDENTCVGVGSNYIPSCETGYNKINEKCYKSCNDDYITVNIKKVNGYVKKDDGSKCISDSIAKN